MKPHRTQMPERQHGMALVEAVIAAGVLGMGLAAAAALLAHALATAAHARELMQAQSLLQDTLDCALARAQPCPISPEVSRHGVTYRVSLERIALGAELMEIQASVQWRTPQGTYSVQGRSRISSLPDPA